MKTRILLLALGGLAIAYAADNNELSRQASDPTASLMAMNLQSTWVGDYHDVDDETWSFQFRPVIPFEVFGLPNILRATVPHQLGVGWSLSAGDLQFTYDWESARWVDLPIGFQLGKVVKLGEMPTRFAINPQYNLKNDRGLEEWSVTFTALFPTF